MAALKNTPIVEYHIELGAKMVPTSGWNMPLHYGEGIIAEHRHTRKACSVFDMCHKGEFRIAGRKRSARWTASWPGPVADLPVGGCRYNFLLDDDGGVRDDLLAFRMADDDLFLVVNAGNTLADANWIRERLPERGAEFYDLSADIAMLDLQGPRSADVLLELGMKLSDLPAISMCRWPIWTASAASSAGPAAPANWALRSISTRSTPTSCGICFSPPTR